MTAEAVGLPALVAGVILLALMVYVLLAGADFGGGVWDLFAGGPRRGRQREIIAHAIGPVWEANHVWMIVAVVLLFTAFPRAFSVIMTALHVPVTVMLVGIVLRGSSFVFRKLDEEIEEERASHGGVGPGDGPGPGWQVTFAVSSLVTPVMLGVILGTLSTPAIGYEDGVVTGGYLRPWLQPFPWTVGFLTLALFAWLAAIYLTLETRDPELRDDFRRRGLGSGAAVGMLGLVAALLGRGAAPEVSNHLLGTLAGQTMVAVGLLSWFAAMALLARRHWVLARLAAGSTTLALLAGWGFGMYPWLVAGAVSIPEAAAPDVTLRLVLGILAAGTFLLVPAFAYLYWVFKEQVLFPGRG